MSDDLILVSPSNLRGASSSTSGNAGTNDNLTNTAETAINTFLGTLSSLAGEPIIGTGITALMAALDNAGVGLAGSLGCFGTGLKILAPAIARIADNFVSLDSSLAATFKELDSLLPQVERYATPVQLITPTTEQLTSLKQYIDDARHGRLPQIQTTTVQVNIEAPHKDGFMGWLADHQWAAWTAVGVITVGGVALTVFTAGGSDVAAGAADAAILGTDAAVTTAAVTTDAAALTTVTAADVTLTTIGGTEVLVLGTEATEATEAALLAYSQEGTLELEELLRQVATHSLVSAGG